MEYFRLKTSILHTCSVIKFPGIYFVGIFPGIYFVGIFQGIIMEIFPNGNLVIGTLGIFKIDNFQSRRNVYGLEEQK